MDHADYSWVFREWLEDLLVVLPNSEHQWKCQFGLLVGISKKDDKHQTLYSCIAIFWVFTVLTNLHWYLILVFKWNSLMTCNVEFLSSCFLAICLSSLVRCLFTSFPLCYDALFFRAISESLQNWVEVADTLYNALLPNMHNLPHYQYPPSEWHICYSHTCLNNHHHPKCIMYIWTSVCLHGCINMSSTIILPYTVFSLP